ncbi:MAG: tetratricopeptide repeat protein [Phycisphaerales bacterium]|nr:tetratricopeptide repeat protein [Phycisphaerales bacterium]
MMVAKRTGLAVSAAILVFVACSAAAASSAEARDEASRQNLPEWSQDPESLPPELRPLDITRPMLPEGAAAEVAELEARIAKIESSWLTLETRAEQDAALDEAIGLAERVLAIHFEYQGNTEAGVRWRDAAGEPSEWYEVVNARRKFADLRLLRALGGEARAALATLDGKNADLERLYMQGKYAEAQAVAERQLSVRRRVFGDEHPFLFDSISNIGVLLRIQGRLEEAEANYREVLEGRRRVLGDEHPDTLISISNMGAMLHHQSKPAEAEPYYREALVGSRRVLGDDHPHTLTSMNNMGGLLSLQGRMAEAEPHLHKVLEGRRRVLGGEHPSTLHSMNSMGVLLGRRGKLAEAEPYLREALEVRRRVLGGDHPDTLISSGHMGVLLLELGRLAEAEPYTREAMEGHRRVLGDDHLETVTSFARVGILFKRQGKLAEAEPYLREALEVRRRVLGDEHPETLSSNINIGLLFLAQGKLSEAEAYCREALDGRRSVLGSEHPSTLQTINDMGFLLQEQGKLSEADAYYREALEGVRLVLGNDHPSTLRSIHNMGALLRAHGRLSEAEPYYSEALETAERLRLDVIGDSQSRAQMAGAVNLPGIAAAYARMLVELGRPAEALVVLERGRGRAGLDLFAGGRRAAEEVLRAASGEAELTLYDAELAAEEEARLALIEAENRLSAAPEEEKAAWTERVMAARVTLGEKTASVFAELRGLVPTLDPLLIEQILAALAPGEALLTFAFTHDGAIALVARDGRVRGVSLAKDSDEAAALLAAIADVRGAIASRPSGGEAIDAGVVAAARAIAAPEELRALLDGAGSVIAVADGPLAGLPMELLFEDLQIAYAPSATIALRPRLEGQTGTTVASSAPQGAGVVLGDPVFAGFEREEPDYPETGILLAMVQEGSNAATAGLTRGDVLLSYGDHELSSAEALGPAIGATAEAMATRGSAEGDRPVPARVWRDGKEIEVSLALGRMGVEMDQRPPADGLRSMATFDRSADILAANATALEQVRFYGGGLGPLPATRLEAAAVAAMLGGDATLLLGEDASGPRLRKAIESSPPRVLHLATHGLLGSSDRPLLASLAFTTPDEPTLEDNGFVTLGDILATWGGQLRDTELVVLSACDTASAVRQGDTMMALPLGLLIAGADTVIASLWKVDDRATAFLMARFYANWLGKAQAEREVDGVQYEAGQPMPKLAALREAQAWLRNLTADDRDRLLDESGDLGENIAASRGVSPARARIVQPDQQRPYEHPYYWAAFVLYGSPD